MNMIQRALILSTVFFLSVIFILANPSTAAILEPTDPDINIRLRNPRVSPNLSDSTLGPIAKYHFGSDAEIDPRAPQLNTLFPGASESFSALYQLHEYNGTTLIPTNNIDNWGSTLSGFNSAGRTISVPASGYNIGGGYQVTILYLDESNGDLTLSYTAGEQGIVIGYSMHLLNLNINPELVSLYREGVPQGKVIALPCGYNLGTSRSELQVSIRDTGTFFDVRSAYDWWQTLLGRSTSSLPCEDLPPILVDPGQSPGGGPVTPRQYTLSEVACGMTQDPEYHSLRPYPASPTCNNQVPDGVWMCGNDLIVRHTYTLDRNDAFASGGNCEVISDTQERCTFNVNGASSVYLDLVDADFPIAGNTEDVPNVISSTNRLNDQQRVNEYVSWYLNGVINRAEEEPLDANNPADIDKLINFSGPLRKLLPRTIQTNERREELMDFYSGNRHNQIIECGGNSPVPCYGTTNTPNPLRITNQGNENSVQFPYTPFSSTEDNPGTIQIGTRGTGVTQDRPGPDGDIKITNVQFSPGQSPASTYPRNSGDRLIPGQINDKNLYFPHLWENDELSETLQLTYLPSGIDGRAGSFTDTSELDKTLEYCELIEARDNDGDSLYGENIREGNRSFLEILRGGIVPIREPQLEGSISYEANFSCVMPRPIPDPLCYTECRTQVDPRSTTGAFKGDATCTSECTQQAECTVPVPVAFGVDVKTPKENESIWDRLVGAHMSVVRRIFPQIGDGTPIDELEDIPGKTTVRYGSENPTANVGQIESDTLAGDPTRARSGQQAQLFFPHLGSIQEYFLHGIQEALRPQGFESFQSNTSTPGSGSGEFSGDLCDPESYRSVFGDNAEGVACVIRRESNCRIPQPNLGCKTVGGTLDYSYGPLQINLLAHPAYREITPQRLKDAWRDAGVTGDIWTCKQAFTGTGSTGSYRSVDGVLRMTVACREGTSENERKILSVCQQYFSNPSNSLEYMKAFYDHDGDFGPWRASVGQCNLNYD